MGGQSTQGLSGWENENEALAPCKVFQPWLCLESAVLINIQRYLPIFFPDSLWAALNSIIKILGFVKGLEFILYSSTGFLEASLLPLFTNKSFSFSHHFLSPPKYTEKLTKWIIVSYLTNNYFLLFLSV